MFRFVSSLFWLFPRPLHVSYNRHCAASSGKHLRCLLGLREGVPLRLAENEEGCVSERRVDAVVGEGAAGRTLDSTCNRR